MSAQPVWKFVDNLGDASPIDYGGLFLYRDETGVYAPELEKLERLDDSDDSLFLVSRVTLDKCEEWAGRVIHAVSFARADPEKYEEWFSGSLDSVARTMGTTREAIVEGLCSDDLTARARAYCDIYDHHGWLNGDSYPHTLTLAQVQARYTEGEIS